MVSRNERNELSLTMAATPGHCYAARIALDAPMETPHRHLRPRSSLFGHVLARCADVATFVDSNRRVPLATFAVVSQIKEKHSVTTTAGFGSTLEQFQTGSVQAVTEDDDRLRCVSRIPPTAKRDAVAGGEFGRLYGQTGIFRCFRTTFRKSKTAIGDDEENRRSAEPRIGRCTRTQERRTANGGPSE